MPRPRSLLVDPSVTPYYHCLNRCVRRAFLCGNDSYSGLNFDHRRQWIADRLKFLTAVFAVDVCSYAMMSNHFHTVLHIDCARAHAWSDDEIAERYARLFPATVNDARELPEDAWNKKVALWRSRLSSLSWFMRCLNEYIARRANRDDHCTGRFWEGRFRSQALLDEGALLTCMAYVDLNPLRAGTATTLEGSDLTAIQERLVAAVRVGGTEAVRGLMPFTGQEGEWARGVQKLPVEFGDYVEVLRWTAPQVARPAPGAKAEGELGSDTSTATTAPLHAAALEPEMPEDVKRVLSQWRLEGVGFVETVREYARRFFTMVGHVQRIDVESRRRGYRRRPDRGGARRLYRGSG